jgi:hypothetical protein
MPFVNRESGVQADFIPEEVTPNAGAASDRVKVPSDVTESAVRTAERRSIELTNGKGPHIDAISPEGDVESDDVTEVDEDVVSVEAPEAKTGQPDDPAAEEDSLPRTDEGVIMDFVPDESDPTPEPLPDERYDVTEIVDEREDDEDALVDDYAEKAEKAGDEKAAKDEAGADSGAETAED